jgi:hypothetical protein
MKGDFSRSTFDPTKHYSSVRMQQGRVQLDADWNEQVDIVRHHLLVMLQDLVGDAGGHLPGFQIQILPSDDDPAADRLPALQIGQGRYYVDGLLCENNADLLFSSQPAYPFEGDGQAAEHGAYLVYLDAWERHISAIEDAGILEPALGGPDTATRTQRVWQVKLLPVEPAEAGSLPDRQELVEGDAWRALAARTVEPLQIEVNNPSDNRLYRVEIHDASAPEGAEEGSQATFKWSRDNGSVAFPVEAIALVQAGDPLTLDISLQYLGRDKRHLRPANWVELTNDLRELRGLPGLMAQVVEAVDEVDDHSTGTQKVRVQLGGDDHHEQVLTLIDEEWLNSFASPECHPVLRRWDQHTRAMPVSSDDWIELEAGITVRFPESNSFHTGDYWLIPVRDEETRLPESRPANPGEERPADTVPYRGIEHRVSPLAFLQWQESAWQVEDYRQPFEPLTAVHARIERAEADLETLRLQAESDLAGLSETVSAQHEQQEQAIARLQSRLQNLEAVVDGLVRRSDGRIVHAFRSDEELDVGDLVALDPTREEYVVRADERNAPRLAGVVAPRPDEADSDLVYVVMYGPALCNVREPVEIGDLLEPSEVEGHAERAHLFTRWFRRRQILGKATGAHTAPGPGLVEVFVQLSNRPRPRTP